MLNAYRRITPAHAGKSAQRPRATTTTEDHPRPRGEKMQFCAIDMPPSGSPPPTRGKDARQHRALIHQRITPAHAGKSAFRAPFARDYQDHHRPRGEKKARRQKMSKEAGSPPPTRGKAAPAALIIRAYRITPAHAGKSAPAYRRACADRDHPRPRGEKRKAITC